MTKNFLNIPIDGTVYNVPEKPNQLSAEDFLENVINKVLEDDRILGFKWDQYTPYFNDGDTCVFSVHYPSFKIKGLEQHKGEDSYRDGQGWASYYDITSSYNRVGETVDENDALLNNVIGFKGSSWAGKDRVEILYFGPDEAFFDLLVSISESMESGKYDSILMKSFGDHCEVELVKNFEDGSSKFVLESYEHE